MKKWLLLIMTALTLTACANSVQDEPISESSTQDKVEEKTNEQAASAPHEDVASPSNEETEPASQSKNSDFIPAKVVKVIDGDTVKVMVQGKEETLRLLLVDTPETVHPSKPVQPFGPEASAFAKSTLSNKDVELELDVGERDKYGRLLVYLHVDGKMFNKLLIETGLARVGYVYAPNTKHVDEFYELQKTAQQKELGIWSIENYATEDEGFNESAEAGTEQEHDQPAAAVETCSIKGNISSSGDKIYHLPEGQYYKVTKEEEMFCSEEEAVNAGYRASKR
ncbi:thermonuclease family protein [Bacillus sp. UMB0893]|uniref:thermonuclease family protein n=1 Tax=Bacillus sp. UMB0893 TaxID=2066053 RepID=UPI000C758A48|nr:thermonuclease family protein [Bacillus sp. UMB0893]PLR69445.1 nuclease [Bacillus sp. UMB0893]